MGIKKRTSKYKHNHYVPQWYQKRFISELKKDNELFYLDLIPSKYLDSCGVEHTAKNPVKQGVRKCLEEEDLYTTKVGIKNSTEIERIFFGKIDNDGKKAVDYFENFSHPSIGKDEFRKMVLFMSVQKLRTPKGLEWLSGKAGTDDKDEILRHMLRLRNLHCAIWTESVWLIADASESKTKFVISDHPVTVYNRRCGPRSHWCRNSNDPDIWLNGTHTIFPLSLNKVLILTNLSWVRNPYKSGTSNRPNPNPLRDAVFKFTDIQTLRHLNQQEVREVNFIIKSRARRYVAAGKEEWLYPEKYINKSDWYDYGCGYLLMPDPRSVTFGGELMWGNYDGTFGGVDSYGRPLGHPEYGKENKTQEEFNLFSRFKGEFAELFGPERRGRSFQMMSLDPERDSERMYKYHLSLVKKRRKKNGNK